MSNNTTFSVSNQGNVAACLSRPSFVATEVSDLSERGTTLRGRRYIVNPVRKPYLTKFGI
jgi:hypothetical protein